MSALFGTATTWWAGGEHQDEWRWKQGGVTDGSKAWGSEVMPFNTQNW